MDTDPDPVSDPDRQALDADPDPVKCCRSDRIRTHNTVSDHLFLLPEGGGGHIPEEGSVWREEPVVDIVGSVGAPLALSQLPACWQEGRLLPP
jgi:hypothetical protein